jgi:hypothetical protein
VVPLALLLIVLVETTGAATMFVHAFGVRLAAGASDQCLGHSATRSARRRRARRRGLTILVVAAASLLLLLPRDRLLRLFASDLPARAVADRRGVGLHCIELPRWLVKAALPSQLNGKQKIAVADVDPA